MSIDNFVSGSGIQLTIQDMGNGVRALLISRNGYDVGQLNSGEFAIEDCVVELNPDPENRRIVVRTINDEGEEKVYDFS